MQKLITLNSLAAPLLENDINTDVIFPARFLLLLEKSGIGKYAFHERRMNTETPFVLDMPQFAGAQILVVGENFGTGSSREHAVWALANLGIRCIVARSFGEIFHANCFRNGVLPIMLDDPHMTAVENAALEVENLSVDLPAQRIRLHSGEEFDFAVDPHGKRALVAGHDEIGMILAEDLQAIEAYEATRAERAPWLKLGPQHKAFLETRQERDQ